MTKAAQNETFHRLTIAAMIGSLENLDRILVKAAAQASKNKIESDVLLGEMLVTDPRVGVISFTGSTGVGRRIMEKGAPTLKRLFLELGGKSASIIFEDTPNFAEAVGQQIVCYHAGQGCATLTRLLVPESRYAEAVMVLEHAYAAYGQMWGKAEDATNFMGPLISERQRDRVMGYIETGIKEDCAQ